MTCVGCSAAGHARHVNHDPEEPTIKLYIAADLHSNSHFLTIIDEQDRRTLEKRLPNDLAVTLRTLEPYRADLVGVAVESTFNWYWLVDGLAAAGYPREARKHIVIGCRSSRSDCLVRFERQRQSSDLLLESWIQGNRVAMDAWAGPD